MSQLLDTRLLCGRLLVGAVVALGVAAPAEAAGLPLAQERTVAGVEDLWNEYPLEENRADPQSPAPEAPAEGDTEPGASPDAGGRSGDAPAPSAGAESGDEAQSQRTPAPDAGDERDPTVRAFIALGIVAVLAVVLARAIGSSWSAPAPPKPAATAGAEARRNLYVKGSTERDSIGDFSGFVQTTVVGDEPNADSLCISDPDRAALLWVLRSEITVIRVPDADSVEGRGVPAGRFPRSPTTHPPSSPA